MSSIWSCWRRSSPRIASASSGSVAPRWAEKKPSCRGSVLAAFTAVIVACNSSEMGRSAQFLHPAQMTVAGKVGGQKSVETVLGDLLAGHARAQRQHVGVVVLAAEARRGEDRKSTRLNSSH